MFLTNSGVSSFASQPSTSRASDASPIRSSTSVGRRYRGSNLTWRSQSSPGCSNASRTKSPTEYNVPVATT